MTTLPKQRLPYSHKIIPVAPDEFKVEVTHDPRASYSRAVQPYATKTARRHLATVGGGQWQMVNVDFHDGDTSGDDGRCRTTYRYVRP